jgi:hypothetical protein
MIREEILRTLRGAYGEHEPLADDEPLDKLPNWAEVDFSDVASCLQRQFGFRASNEEWRRFLEPDQNSASQASERHRWAAPTLDALTDFVLAGQARASARALVGDTHRAPRLLAFSVATGGALGCLAYAIMLPRYADVGLFGLCLAAPFGLVIGLCCSPFVVILLTTRAVPAVRPLVLWPTAVLTAILAYFMREDAIFTLMGLAAAAFLAACGLARLIVPRTWNVPGLCRFCAYDLRASLEFGRCPECGHGFDERPWFMYHPASRGPRSALVRAAAFFVRHPILPIMAVVAILLVPRGYLDERRARRETAFTAGLEAACERGELFYLRAHTPFRWDTVYVIPPYSARSDVESLLGFSWREFERTDEMSESRNLLVFVHDGAVTEYLMISRRTDFGVETRMRPWSADEAILEAHPLDDGRCELRPAAPASPASRPGDPN